MLSNIKESEYVTQVTYSVNFDDGGHNGYSFPCDEHGNPLPDMYDSAKENYKWCMQHPEKFVRFNKVDRMVRHYRDPRHGTCKCGETVYLTNEYMGACSCWKCGQWYNLSGQELLPPDEWGWDGTPMDDD